MGNEIAKRVKEIVGKQLGIDESEIADDANFVEGLGADSIDTVELTIAFQEEFGCEIPENAARKLITVKDVIDLIESSV